MPIWGVMCACGLIGSIGVDGLRPGVVIGLDSLDTSPLVAWGFSLLPTRLGEYAGGVKGLGSGP